jgi:hypothetical protein
MTNENHRVRSQRHDLGKDGHDVVVKRQRRSSNTNLSEDKINEQSRPSEVNELRSRTHGKSLFRRVIRLGPASQYVLRSHRPVILELS